ncbi:hypothetical protein QBC44DRAFT_325344 [Cladorrhinum sp. PSN332]|nr:hypothetical protein QBC44DRAFT_325344 [Cladorrhinum sp. PSN332]
MLSDISHDIYYGLKITEDYETVRALFCLANTDLIFSSASPQSTISRARLASLTLASAVQNNPTALAEIEKHWSKLSNEWCPNTSAELGRAIFKLVPPSSSSSTNSWKNRLADPSLTKARISAISGLLKSDMIRRDFLAAGGMERVLEVLVESEDAEWEPAQRKVGVLALDNFLDADMGAKLGEWPRGIQASSEVCAQKDKNPIDKDESSAVSAECWDWYAKNFAARHRKDKGHWSHDLVRKLGEQRKVNNNNDKRSATLKAKKVKKGGRGKEEL